MFYRDSQVISPWNAGLNSIYSLLFYTVITTSDCKHLSRQLTSINYYSDFCIIMAVFASDSANIWSIWLTDDLYRSHPVELNWFKIRLTPSWGDASGTMRNSPDVLEATANAIRRMIVVSGVSKQSTFCQPNYVNVITFNNVTIIHEFT